MLYSVQFLRGFAALLVVMTHIVNKEVQNQICSKYWFNMGGTGIDLFFIISGFIMCYTTHDKKVSFINFMKLRIERIIPLYWFFTTLALILYLLPLNVFHAAANSISVLDSYLLLPLGKTYLVGTGWTLSYEFYFYLIFSFFLLFPLQSYVRYVYISVFIAIITCIGWVVNDHRPIIDFVLSHWLIEFVFGIISFALFKHIKIPPLWCFIMIICGLPVLLYQNIDDFLLRSPYRVFHAGLPMFLIFNGCLHLENCLPDPKNVLCSLFEKLGNSSYSLYLSHPFTLVVASRLCIMLHLTSPLIFIVILLFASVLFGFFAYRFIEQPMLKWVKSKI
ncbi:acyltransferase family protein [Commensalibacter communis]|uniref:acyltransferase family protein n=1 Tax=Commensalibacter communis TaxID=2972786 RepID=UPI0022FF62E8|nr:acyltransferase [Commensalibacter communis]CAI3957894.1 Peptidoglycan/LPS O-acetylase OafA/YrhL [Commensalibacter communis]CAI3958546.1 Peptidoglycan/LPS O-acetylase OafA/YrhL [Commensalibacter communis]